MIIYGFYDFNIVQKRLLQTCLNEKETMIFLPYEPTPAFEYVKPTLKWLKDNGFEEASTEMRDPQTRKSPLDHLCHHLFDDGKPVEIPPDVIQIVSAPGEPREVREVIREILQSISGKGNRFSRNRDPSPGSRGVFTSIPGDLRPARDSSLSP